MGVAMLSWLPRGRAKNEKIDVDAEALIHDFGLAAYSEARRREHEASSETIALVWGDVALAVARKAGSLIGQDISVRTAMDPASAPNRDPSAAPTSRYSRIQARPLRDLAAIPNPICRRVAKSRIDKLDGSRGSSGGHVGSNRRRGECRLAASYHRIAYSRRQRSRGL